MVRRQIDIGEFMFTLSFSRFFIPERAIKKLRGKSELVEKEAA